MTHGQVSAVRGSSDCSPSKIIKSLNVISCPTLLKAKTTLTEAQVTSYQDLACASPSRSLRNVSFLCSSKALHVLFYFCCSKSWTWLCKALSSVTLWSTLWPFHLTGCFKFRTKFYPFDTGDFTNILSSLSCLGREITPGKRRQEQPSFLVSVVLLWKCFISPLAGNFSLLPNC